MVWLYGASRRNLFDGKDLEVAMNVEDSVPARFLFSLISPAMAEVMESPWRYRLNDPVKALRAAGVQPEQQVLEVGCGTGFFTLPAAELVGSKGCVHAIDVYSPAVKWVEEKAKNAGLTNVKVTPVDACETGLPGDSFDLILLFGILPSPTLPLNRLVPEMHRLLKPKGTLAVWTAIPFWSPKSLARGGFFSYVGRKDGVHRFEKARGSD
jgi:demethylmenaquinone methyltransferase/2-methoxy-6-polyprenyl-1,4-benzoquinol methylase